MTPKFVTELLLSDLLPCPFCGGEAMQASQHGYVVCSSPFEKCQLTVAIRKDVWNSRPPMLRASDVAEAIAEFCAAGEYNEPRGPLLRALRNTLADLLPSAARPAFIKSAGGSGE